MATKHWRLLLWTFGLAPAITCFLWPRFDFDVPPMWQGWNDQLARNDIFLGLVFARFFAVLIIGIELWVTWYWMRRKTSSRNGIALLLFGLCVCASFFLSAIFGTVRWLPSGLMGLPLMFCAAYFVPRPSLDWFGREISRISAFYIVGSMALALPAFGWIVEWPYELGIIPGLNIRLHGLAAAQGALGIYILLYFLWYFLLDTSPPSRWKGVVLILAVLAMVLTQSKITWICCVCLFAYRVYLVWTSRTGGAGRSLLYAFAAWAGLLAVAAACAFGPLILMASFGDAGSPSSTLTGRIEIWKVCVELWQQNPLFGYGNDLWSNTMAQDYLDRLGWLPTGSHNQFFQSLAQTGLIGLLCFLCYAAVFFRYSWLANRYTSGACLFFSGLLLARCLTETWLKPVMTDGALYFHFVALALIYIGLDARRSAAAMRAAA